MMTRLIALLVVALSTACANGQPLVQPSRPNILIIFTDDQGYADFGCFGSETNDTPRMDALAAQGTMYTSFYAMNVCGPSRSALLTGRYPVRSGGWGMPADEITWAELLQGAGYQTWCVGKWDVSDRRAIQDRMPLAQGFDRYFGALGANDNGVVHFHRDNEAAGRTDDMGSLTTTFTEQAIQYIRERDPEKPFALYLSHTMMHTDIDASDRFRGTSDGGLYGDVVEEFDYETGRLLDVLDELELTENTLVIYTTDNGPWNQPAYIERERGHPEGAIFWGEAGPLRAGKGSNYEAGVRVPAIVRWPGVVEAGAESDAIFSTLDFLPTFATLCGFEVPDDRPIDGVDQTALLTGEDPEGARDTYVYMAHVSRRDNIYATNGIRVGDWKYLRAQQVIPGYAQVEREEVVELYNLAEDLGETTNLASEHPERVEQMEAMLSAWWAEAAAERGLGRQAE